MAQLSKLSTEIRKHCFSTVKFSTQVLISLWKSGLRRNVTSDSSTSFSALHNLCATSPFLTSSSWQQARIACLQAFQNWNSRQEAEENVPRNVSQGVQRSAPEKVSRYV